ncbi:MAG: hypothetical protein IAE83_20035 [Anaerolinea sp.]|nr:hypothetical protein [Anaerolinea sp.]
MRSKAHLLLENALLRQQLIILKRQVKQPRFPLLDQLVMVWIGSPLHRWQEALLLTQPETLLGQYKVVGVQDRKHQPRYLAVYQG